MYQMTRLEAGDYLLPSNDLTTLWRIYKYHEDGLAEWGPDENGDYHKIEGDFWAVAKWSHTFARALRAEQLEEALDDWSQWETRETLIPTRKAAIEAALR